MPFLEAPSMRTLLQAVSGITVAALSLAVVAIPCGAVRADDAKDAVDFLRGEVRVIGDNKKKIEEKVEALQKLERLGKEIVDRKLINAADPKSVELAALTFNTLEKAAAETKAAAEQQGKRVERVNGFFQIVDKGVAQGQLPQSVGTAVGELKAVVTESKISLDNAKKVLADADTATKEIRKGYVGLGLDVPSAAGGVAVRNTWVSVIGKYLPSGTITGSSANGYVVLLNNDNGSRSGVVKLECTGGTITPTSVPFTIEAGGTKRIDFTVSVPEGGNANYSITLSKN
jgi:uncharacterized protein YdbL (DUF1318 family)